MSKVKVAFNGMGRIGKNVMRVIVEQFNDQIEIVAGNDLVSAKDIAQGLPKDSIFGRFPVDVSLKSDNIIKVGDHEITVYADRSFTFVTKTPPASRLILKSAKLSKGSSEPNKDKVGKISESELEKIAEVKMADLNAADMDAAVLIIAGTARSMGLDVEGL